MSDTTTATTQAVSEEPEALAESWKVTPDEMVKGTALQPDQNIAEDLRWLYRWAVSRGLSPNEVSDMIGCDRTVLPRLWRGKYRNAGNQVLPPNGMILSRIRTIREQEKQSVLKAGENRIRTPLVDEIWTIARKIWAQKSMGFLVGPTHIGKSESLKWFRDENNHGTTIYVRCSAMSGQTELMRLIAEAMKLSGYVPTKRLKSRIMGSLDSRNFMIIDEFHQVLHTYMGKSARKCFELIREIHDVTGAPMLLCGTHVIDHELSTGVDAAFLKQLSRRGNIKAALPNAVRVKDAVPVCAAYGLQEPDLITAKRWKDQPRLEHVMLLEDICYNHGIKRLILTLQDAVRLAQKQDRDVAWSDFMRAGQIFRNLETQEIA